MCVTSELDSFLTLTYTMSLSTKSTGEAAFLLEPQSTNLIDYSEDLSSWATFGSPIVTTSLPAIHANQPISVLLLMK